MRNLTVIVFLMSFSLMAMAEVKIYQSTDNTGINKKEQIDTLEKYLVDLSGTLKNMEATLNQNTIKLKTIEATVQSHDSQIRQMKESLTKLEKDAEKAGKAPKESTTPAVTAQEIENINADILAIKNKDIEQLRTDTQAMRSSIQQIQQMLRINQK